MVYMLILHGNDAVLGNTAGKSKVGEATKGHPYLSSLCSGFLLVAIRRPYSLPRCLCEAVVQSEIKSCSS